MGLHCGETIKEESPEGRDDFFGKNVIVAARIAAQARGGQILVSALLKALVDSAGDISFDDGREVQLKGLSGVHRMHEVIWSAGGERPRPEPPEPVAAPSASAEQPEVLYCTTRDGVRITFTAYGEGPPIVFAPYFTESFSLQASVPEEREFYRRLGAGRRIVRYDGRGTGLSQRDVEDFSHEAMVWDLEAVVKALGLQQFALWGQLLGGPRTIDFTTRHPELDVRLILVTTLSRGADAMKREQLEALAALARANWNMAAQLFADMVGREQSAANKRRRDLFRDSASGEMAARLIEEVYEVDLTHLFPQIKGPTLILQRVNDNLFRLELGKSMAAQIPNARLVPLEGETVIYDPRDVAEIVQAVDAFLGEP